MHFVSSKDALLWNKRLISWILSTSISTKIGAQWKKMIKSRYTINVCLFGGINEHLSPDSLNSNLINWLIEPIWSADIKKKNIYQLNVIRYFLRRLNDLNLVLKKTNQKRIILISHLTTNTLISKHLVCLGFFLLKSP